VTGEEAPAAAGSAEILNRRRKLYHSCLFAAAEEMEGDHPAPACLRLPLQGTPKPKQIIISLGERGFKVLLPSVPAGVKRVNKSRTILVKSPLPE